MAIIFYINAKDKDKCYFSANIIRCHHCIKRTSNKTLISFRDLFKSQIGNGENSTALCDFIELCCLRSDFIFIKCQVFTAINEKRKDCQSPLWSLRLSEV